VASGRRLSALLVAPLAALAALDLLLSALSLRPGDSPLAFFLRTHEARIDPFVAAGGGALEIRPDWVNDGVGLRGRRGLRAGRQYLLPGFRPVRIAEQKAPSALRVFALGGSTTFGLYVGADAAFPARLAEGLRARAGGRAVEVVNLGCAGFASDRVAALLPRVLDLSPDLVVVLAGHNEMLGGHQGPASELSPALRLRARLAAASSLFAWWDHLVSRTLRRVEAEQVSEEAAAVEAGEIPTYVPEAVPESARSVPDAAFRARAAQRYAANVARMLSLARAAGVPLVFAVPAANLRSPPAVSAHADGFAASAEFDTALRAARALLESGKPDRALERLDAAVALSPDHAQAHYLRGEALRALGRDAEARAAYRDAVDRDVRTHRITTSLEQALLDTLRAEGADFVDLRPLFQTDLGDATAHALFVDHLHPTAEGHQRIADALLQAAAQALGLDGGGSNVKEIPRHLRLRRERLDSRASGEEPDLRDPKPELLREPGRRHRPPVPRAGSRVAGQPSDHRPRHTWRDILQAMLELRVEPALAQRLGDHEARLHVEERHAGPRVLDRQHARHPLERRLGGGVGEAPAALAGRRRGIRGARRRHHVHDRAAPPVEHPRQQPLHQPQRRQQVAAQHLLRVLGAQVEQPLHRARTLVDAVVHQQVDRAELRLRALDRGGEARLFEQVEAHGKGAGAARAHVRGGRLQAARQRPIVAVAAAALVALALAERARRHRHVEARVRERQRRRRTDAPGRSGDERDPARHGADR
jgi:lysophospholipase L1-like esterase